MTMNEQTAQPLMGLVSMMNARWRVPLGITYVEKHLLFAFQRFTFFLHIDDVLLDFRIFFLREIELGQLWE
jgi:hypothetical protein